MTFTLLALALLALPVTADIVVTNAKVWTVDAAVPEAQAVAAWHGRILAVGSDADIKPLIGPATKVVDARGRRVLPGFYDSHVHYLGGGRSLAQVQLKDAKDEAEFGRRLASFDANASRDRWLLGGGWDHDRAFGGTLPTAATIDKYVKNRPVFIRRYDGHMALANTAALKLAGITAATKDPAGGVIFRNADGSPSGILKDNAMNLLDAIIPEPAEDEILEGIKAALAACAENGVTSVQDMDGSAPETRRTLLRILQRLEKQNELTVRIDVRWPIANQADVIAVGATANFGGDFVRIGGVKGYMDGSLGSRTAKMFDPYVGETTNTGVFVTEPAVMKELVRTADKAGLSIGIHAIGDRANAELLDIYAAAAAANGPRDRRLRIEHAQHLRVADYPRFKALGVVASMQPYHVIDDGRWAEGRIGGPRCAASYAYRSLLDSGAVLAFGSDWPVAPLNVLEGIDAAVTRRPLDGKHPDGWYPAQAISVAEAVKAYTLGSAYAGFQESDRGTIAVGKRADVVILSADILDPSEQKKIVAAKVDVTVIGGRVVFERGGK